MGGEGVGVGKQRAGKMFSLSFHIFIVANKQLALFLPILRVFYIFRLSAVFLSTSVSLIFRISVTLSDRILVCLSFSCGRENLLDTLSVRWSVGPLVRHARVEYK